jgi:large subunit ribosomal protein L21
MAKTATTPKTSTKATSVKAAKAPAKKAAPKKMSEEIAVILTGGKQYIVAVGDVLDVELLEGEHKEGDTITFDKVLMVDNGKDATLGTPYIKGAKVTATYEGLKKGEKVSIFRYKAKSNRDRRIGHRQKYARVRIASFS